MQLSLKTMNSQKGFTLSELMTSVAIFAILVLLSTLLSSWAVARFYSIKDRMVTEALGYRAENLFRASFGQAMDIQFQSGGGPEILPAVLPVQTGMIRDQGIGADGRRVFLFDEMGDSANWERIAAFYRESSTGLVAGAIGAARGAPAATFVSYRAPTAGTSGVIFFDQSTPPGVAGVTQASYEDAFIDRVSGFGITKTRHPSYNKVTSIEVLLRLRYHVFGAGTTSWCPALDIQNGMAGCIPANRAVVWRDLERRFVVSLRDNLMRRLGDPMVASAVNSEERTSGNLYFFRTISPMQ